MNLNLCISNGTVSTKIYDKWDDFDFDIVNFPFLDGDVPRHTSYGVYISQLIRFARASSNLSDFNYHTRVLQKVLSLGSDYSVLRFIKHSFITNLQSIPPLLKHIFVTFLPSSEKQINSLRLVSAGGTDK